MSVGISSCYGFGSVLIVFLDFYTQKVAARCRVVKQVLGIICMACASPARLPGTNWFLFVVVTSFIATLIWVFIYLLSIREALKLPINWILTELFNTTITTILYITAFIVQLSVWSPSYYKYWKDSNLTAGCFGLFNALAYTAGTYYLYLEHKSTTSSSGP